MFRIFLAVVLLLSLTAASTVPVNAQETAPGNNSSAPTPAPENDSSAPGSPSGNDSSAASSTVAVEIDPVTTLSKWRYENDTFYLTFNMKVPGRVVLVDSARAMEAWSEGSGKQSVDLEKQGFTLGSGKTTVEYPATTFDGQAAITISTSRESKMIFTDGITTGGPWERTTPGSAWLGGVSVAIVMGGFAAYKVKNRVPDEPEALDL